MATIQYPISTLEYLTPPPLSRTMTFLKKNGGPPPIQARGIPYPPGPQGEGGLGDHFLGVNFVAKRAKKNGQTEITSPP